MKIAMIGCSGHFYSVMEVIDKRSDLEFVGFAKGVTEENDEDFINMFMKKYNFQIYDDYAVMLDELMPEVVVVNSHYYMNAYISAKVIGKGINCYCEKPVATTLEDLEYLKGVFSKNRVNFAAMLEMRCYSVLKTAYKVIREGMIGDVIMITAQKSYKLGETREFFKKRETFGGIIPWVGIHAIDLISWLSGKEIISVNAMHSRLYNSEHNELETAAICILGLSDGGMASINIDYLRPAAAETHGDDRVRIAGSKGILEINRNKVSIIDGLGEKELPLQESTNLFDEFVNQVLGRGICIVTAEDSFKATEFALKARLSADKMQIVKMV